VEQSDKEGIPGDLLYYHIIILSYRGNASTQSQKEGISALIAKEGYYPLKGLSLQKQSKAAKGKEQYAQLLSLAVIPCIG